MAPRPPSPSCFDSEDVNDEFLVGVDSLLDQSEKWARESLRDDGFSDAFIDAWIEFDDGWDLKEALDLIMAEHDHKFLLIRHIGYLRDRLSNGNRSPIDWVWDGFLIAWFHHAGSLSDSEKLWFSELQKNNQKQMRKRLSLAKIAVHHILGEADEFPGTVPFRNEDKQINLENIRKGAVSSRGRDLERFRHFVGKKDRIKVNGTSIEITSVENSRHKIVGYVFENRDLPSNEDPPTTPMTTIRSIISRRKSQPARRRKHIK